MYIDERAEICWLYEMMSLLNGGMFSLVVWKHVSFVQNEYRICNSILISPLLWQEQMQKHLSFLVYTISSANKKRRENWSIALCNLGVNNKNNSKFIFAVGCFDSVINLSDSTVLYLIKHKVAREIQTT